MKVSRGTWVVLGIVVFVIAFAGLFMLYNRAIAERQPIIDQIEKIRETLQKFNSEKSNLNSQLTSLQNDLNTAKERLNQAKEAFPKTSESIEYDELLFSFAGRNQLEVTNITASREKEEKRDNVTFTASPFVIDVQGLAPSSNITAQEDYRAYVAGVLKNILAFTHTIVISNDFSAATLESIDIFLPEILTDEELADMVASEQPLSVPTASIKFTLYTYKGQ